MNKKVLTLALVVFRLLSEIVGVVFTKSGREVTKILHSVGG